MSGHKHMSQLKSSAMCAPNAPWKGTPKQQQATFNDADNDAGAESRLSATCASLPTRRIMISFRNCTTHQETRASHREATANKNRITASAYQRYKRADMIGIGICCPPAVPAPLHKD